MTDDPKHEISLDWRTWLRRQCEKFGTPVDEQSPQIADIAIGVEMSIDSLLAEVRRLRAENERLKSGAFTAEEFQNLCHDKYPCARIEFEDGCREYTDKLFGPLEGDVPT